MGSGNSNMDSENNESTGKTRGTIMSSQDELFVKKVFEHPHEKDKDGNPVVMDYATMRMYYG